MKGIIFTVFSDFVETNYGVDQLDDILDSCDLASGGAYTVVGTYDFSELQALFGALCKAQNMELSEALRLYGHHLAAAFVTQYPDFFQEVDDTFSLLKNIENHIHVEVRKLYPNAELPSFSHKHDESDRLTLIYSSPRKLGDLVVGLIEAASGYYKETIRIERKSPIDAPAESEHFYLTRLSNG
ncbi:heme NO-binding domain-containing protein [Teredinibacter turnerae]|uniref:heme NO-binding domain-containing protein n=1 Tax=Teredinibacter turnerae TaxID=2426 RepID=UPI00040CE5F8|nr:heme NO-binding domain-containing protein [Teredinibacter turnerae]